MKRNDLIVDRRSFVVGAGALTAAMAFGRPARAQEWVPTQPIDFVVHTGPGAGGDVFARGLVGVLEKENLVPVRMQVSNRPGGGTTTAAAYIHERAGDPYTLGVYSSLWLTSTLMQEEAKVGPLELTPIVNLVKDFTIFVTAANSPYKNVEELIEIGKTQPGVVKVAGGGLGSGAHLIMPQMQKIGIDWQFVPFPSGGERVAALLGGHVQMMVMEPAEAVTMMRQGQIRVLAKAETADIPEFPDVRPLSDYGVDVGIIPTFRGIAAPPGIAPEVMKYYETLFAKMVQTPSWAEYIEKLLTTSAYMDAAANRKFLEDFKETIRPVLELSGIKVVR